MGHFSTLTLILFTFIIVLNFGGGNCSTEYVAYVDETNGDYFAMGSAIDFIINEIMLNWMTAFGVLGGVLAVATLGVSAGFMIIGIVVLQVLVNVFILPLDCIHSLGLPYPLGTVLIVFINLYVLIMAISFMFNRDV